MESCKAANIKIKLVSSFQKISQARVVLLQRKKKKTQAGNRSGLINFSFSTNPYHQLETMINSNDGHLLTLYFHTVIFYQNVNRAELLVNCLLSRMETPLVSLAIRTGESWCRFKAFSHLLWPGHKDGGAESFFGAGFFGLGLGISLLWLSKLRPSII